MREIKFRAWDIPNNCFIPNDCYVISNDGKSLGMMIKDWNNYLIDEYMYSPNQIITQFTGLTDKNGIPIYESDIIKMDNGTLYTIVYRGMGFWFVDSDNEGYVFSPSAYQYEVIGNQFENKELL